MTRRKLDGPGVTLSSGDFLRFIDVWREAAARPLKAFRVFSSTPGRPFADVIWTLEEDGKQIARWREGDMPNFSWWLQDRLYELNGAWHVARVELSTVEGKKRAGRNRALKLKTAAALEDAKLAKIAKSILLSDGPMPHSALADHVADRTGRGKQSLRKKLPKLLKK